MGTLNELINHLYHEGIEEGQLLLQEKTPTPLPAMGSGTALDVARLEMLTEQMEQLLTMKEKTSLQDTTASALSHEEVQQLQTQWNTMWSEAEGLRSHIRSLEADIARMQPWGDFDILKVKRLYEYGCCIRFWRIKAAEMPTAEASAWYAQYNASLVNQDTQWLYLVTVTQTDDDMRDMPTEALEQEICPSPASTLIMLQTRDKDRLKRVEDDMHEQVMSHYAALYATLRQFSPLDEGLPQPHTERHRLRNRLKKLFKR